MRNTLADEQNWWGCDLTSSLRTLRKEAATSQHFHPQDARDVLDHGDVRMSGCEDQIYDSTPVMYQTGPFTFSDLQEMGLNTSSSDQTTQSTSRRHSFSVPAGVQTSGQTSQCTPQLCGPDAACLEFPKLLDLKDCTSEPGVAEKLSSRPKFTHSSQPSPGSIAETIPSRPSTSQPSKQSRNSKQRIQRGNLKDANVRLDSKKAHSLVERRYRENLNSNITQLHLTLMKTKRMGSNRPSDQHENSEEQQQGSPRMCKSDIMLEAVAYVHQTEVELRHMANEIELLTTRVRQLEKLACS
jgi:Helix-loop-helix DNA-binding domain